MIDFLVVESNRVTCIFRCDCNLEFDQILLLVSLFPFLMFFHVNTEIQVLLRQVKQNCSFIHSAFETQGIPAVLVRNYFLNLLNFRLKVAWKRVIKDEDVWRKGVNGKSELYTLLWLQPWLRQNFVIYLPFFSSCCSFMLIQKSKKFLILKFQTSARICYT